MRMNPAAYLRGAPVAHRPGAWCKSGAAQWARPQQVEQHFNGRGQTRMFLPLCGAVLRLW